MTAEVNDLETRPHRSAAAKFLR